MLSPASPPEHPQPGFSDERKCKRKREDDSGTPAAKRHRPPSPPSTARDQLLDSPPRPRSTYTRTLSIADWVDESAAVAMPPESQPDIAPSDVTFTDSRASSSRSRVTQTKPYRKLIRLAGIVPETWRPMPHRVQAAVDAALAAAPTFDAHLRSVASRFCRRSRELAEDDANESGWKGAFLAMVDDLRLECGGDEIKVASDLDWCEELLPQPERLPPPQTVPQRRSRDGHGSNTAVHSGPRPPMKLKKPRPDVQLSLARQALASRVEASLLDQFFETEGLTCNPSRQSDSESGFFPFLVCELKSDATGGSFFGAQNQACVAAAAALRIFSDLQDLQSAECPDVGPSPVFAVCSEGPRFELFAYYPESGQAKYVGKEVRQWKTIKEEDALDLVRCVAGIIEWARSNLKTQMVQAIDAIWEQSHNPTHVGS